MPLSTGYILNNRYRIVKLLGQGGFGAVYRAWDVNLEMPCALKENTESSSEAARQFLREAQILHTLRHPNLPLVKDHFVIPDQGQYLVMDYIEGLDLQEKIAAGNIPILQSVSWVLQICSALIYMHTQNPAVIHRDIKPANIKITPQGRAVLVDFGIAKVFDTKSRTTAGARAVTPGFSPFEQYGSAPTDARTDVYALGATLYSLLTRQDPAESIARVAGTDLIPPRALNPDINHHLEQVLLKALAIMPVGRYQSMAEFNAALNDSMSGAVELLTTTPLVQSAPVGLQTIGVQEEPGFNRLPSRPPAAPPPPRTPSSAPGFETIQPGNQQPKKSLPWKWIIGGVVAFVLLICTPLTILGISQLMRSAPTEIVSVTRPTSTDRPANLATHTPRPTELPSATPTEVPPTGFSQADCPRPELVCVGVVTDVGEITDGSFNQSAWEGVTRTQQELGTLVQYIETMNAADYSQNIARFADQGFDVIITVGFAMGTATYEAALQYPNVYFIGIDQYLSETLSNLVELIFQEDQAGFLAGVLAGGLSQSGVVAGVYGTDLVPPVVNFAEGFASGAAYANPNIQVITTYHPGGLDIAFTDPEWGAATAAASMDAGADVIFAAGGATGNGALIATANRGGVFCIGVDSDQWNTLSEARPCLVSSAMKRIDQGVFDLVQQYILGNLNIGNYYGQVGLASFHDFADVIPPETLSMLRFIEADMGTNSPALQETSPLSPANILIWSNWGEGTYQANIQEVFRSYMELNPQISIQIYTITDLSTEFPTAIAAVQGSDILVWGNDVIGQYAGSGYIRPLDDLGFNQSELYSTYEPAAATGVIWGGSIWGLPTTQEGIAIVYNTALASPADFPSDPLDLNGLLQSAADYYARTGRYLLCNQALGSAGDAYHAAPIFFGFGMPGYVDETGAAHLNTPEGLAAANWILEFRNYAPAETSHEICNSMMANGEIAAWWTGPWALSNLEAAGISYGILPMGRPYDGIQTMMITSNAWDRGNQAAALDIMLNFTNKAYSTYLANTNGTVPANSAALWDPSIQALPSIAGFGASMNLGIPMGNSLYSGAQWGPVANLLSNIWFNGLSPETALTAAQSEIESAIAAIP
jgi:basic membrane lipoprotein Med (substrate-binding protein (PBP1-ABC) superfamily)/serine/threonine protein kinase/maltose-binding protein MalE